MATHTPNELIIQSNDFTYKLRLTDANICLLELNDGGGEALEDPALSAVFIPREDWLAVKRFIDKNMK